MLGSQGYRQSFRVGRGKDGVALAVNLSEYDIHGADNRGNMGQLVAFCHVIHGLKMWEPRCTQFCAIGFVSAIRDKIHTKFTLWRLNRGVYFTCWYVEALG